MCPRRGLPPVSYGFDTADATYPANDTVAAWAALGSC
jgi:hypothetical protein